MNRLKKVVLTTFTFALLSCGKQFSRNQTSGAVEFWLTNADKSVLFEKQSNLPFESLTNKPIIEVNSNTTYQEMDGFGYCLNGGSAQLLMKMDRKQRSILLQEIFGLKDNSIGISVLRLSIGASDLDDRVFSYNDLPTGETDTKLDKFSIENDRRTGLITIIKEIQKINPKLYIMGSPWSAPTWMKTNNQTKGGSLKPEYYDSYALYFVKYIQAMKEEGIAINSITIQNEPLHPGNNPSMYMEAKDQAVFIKNHLGPAFEKSNIKTKILVYDHNCDKPEYPLEILNDAAAKKYVDGSAFHLYGGTIDALTKVHNAHPDKNVYFTEQWTGGPGNFATDLQWNVEHLVVGAPNNWAKLSLQWNLAADPNYDPHTDQGGCTSCMGAITLDGSNVTRNVAYYSMAHAAKFVRPGAKRIASVTSSNLPNVAFKNSDGKTVLIVVNTQNSTQDFAIRSNEKTVNASLKAGSVGTYVW